jgi:signal transduction histidine kinase
MWLASFTPFILKDITYAGTEIRPVYGKGIILFLLYSVSYVGYGLFVLARKYAKHAARFERVQLKYTFWGLLIAMAGVMMLSLILPLAGIRRYSSPLTPLVTIVATGSISYALVRHRLMDIGIVFRNALIYPGIAVVMAGVLSGLMFALEPLSELSLGNRIVIAAICAAILIQPTRRLLEYLVDRYYFRGRYDYQAALAEFSVSMTRILNLEDLQHRIVNEVVSILQVKTATLLLANRDGKRFMVACSIPSELSYSVGGIEKSSAVAEKMSRERVLLVRDELRRILPYSQFEPLEQGFDRMEAEVFIPLEYRGELIGMLSLGEKRSADIFSREDLNLLKTLGNQAAVALENALLHHTVTMLKNHNENILKYMSSGVIATDRDHVINTCNDKARSILRLPYRGTVNRKINVLPDPLREMLADTLSEKTAYSNHEIEILSERGSISYLNASTSLIKDEGGEVTGALLVFNDLTDIKLLESEMWRADKLASLGTLAAGMAHEIKNPLVSIKTFAQLLPTRYEDKDFRDTFSSITVDEVERINLIVEKLLEFARPTAPVFEVIDVIEIAEEVLLLLSPEATKHGITVTKNFEVSSAPITGDKAQLKQSLLNLCLNGLQAIEKVQGHANGELSVSVGFRKRSYRTSDSPSLNKIARMFYGTEVVASAEEAETLVIKVRDTGRGISKTDVTKIFDPFFTTKEKGMGLGLAVVHGIIKEHSGTIHVESEERSGTEFTISLPVTQIFTKERV